MDLYNQLANMSSSNTSKTFEFNHNEALLNRKWQEQMSNTAHQREVKDLQKAGLNPVLSATNGAGASTPSGSTASGSADTSAISAIASLANSAISANAQITSASINAQAMRDVANTNLAGTQYSVDNPNNITVGGAIWRLLGGEKFAKKFQSEFSNDKAFLKEAKNIASKNHGVVKFRDLSVSSQMKLASKMNNTQDIRSNRHYLMVLNPTV